MIALALIALLSLAIGILGIVAYFWVIEDSIGDGERPSVDGGWRAFS